MKNETKQKLLDAIEYCNKNDKSTEFMIQYMMDMVGVDHDCVMNFLYKTKDKKESKNV